MPIDELPLTKNSWAKMIAQPAQEFPSTRLPIKSGKIPAGLRGSFYRNGPGQFERGGIRVGHPFDGDGAVLAIHFTNQGATGVYRYVQTAKYVEETAAGKLIYGNYGMVSPGIFWNRWLKPVKSCANTSVLRLPDKLLALWEGDRPYALNPDTLETQGIDDLGGLHKGLTYSAHPKYDPQTREIFNFGVSLGRNIWLNLYKSDATGKVLRSSAFKLDGFPMMHDYVLAGRYMVFFMPPTRIDMLPVMAGLSCYSEAVRWRPNLGTQVLVFDRETLSLISRSETEPWFQWHFANGYVDASGTIILDLVKYPEFRHINQWLKEIVSGQTCTLAKSALWRVHLNPLTAKVTALEEVLDRNCEFPTVPLSQVGQSWCFTYLSLHRQGDNIATELYNTIARFDYQTETLIEADLGENRYPTEPIYAPDAIERDQGWILTVVYDGNSHTSEVWIFDSDRLNEPPVCRLELPSVIPVSFHGTWKAG